MLKMGRFVAISGKEIWTTAMNGHKQFIHLILIRNQKQESSNKEIEQGLLTRRSATVH